MDGMWVPQAVLARADLRAINGALYALRKPRIA
jgi:hypothetical protein